MSTQTFYDFFADREDGLAAACSAAADRVFDHALAACAAAADVPARAWLEGLLGACHRHPDAARLLFVEGQAGGPLIRGLLRRAFAEVERALEPLLEGPRSSRPLDLPAGALLGGVGAVVCSRLRAEGAPELPGLLDDLWAWVCSYQLAARAPRSSVASSMLLSCVPPLPADLAGSSLRLDAQPLPRRRHRLPVAVAGRMQRARIMCATAELMLARGYADVTVTDIVAASRISRTTFYTHFASKQDAFLAAQQHGSVGLLRACASAYFAPSRWPQRVWNVLRVVTGVVEANPEFAHVRLVDCYTAGPVAVDHMEQLRGAAGVFLQEGFRFRRQAGVLPTLCVEAITGAVFELVRRDLAAGDGAIVPRRLPQLTFVAIAPFTGPRVAARIVRDLSARASS